MLNNAKRLTPGQSRELTALLTLLSLFAGTAARATPLESLWVDYEVGPLRVFQNDGRYGAGGTSYTAQEVGQQRNLVPAQRLSLEWRAFERHSLVLLYAPLDVTTRAVLTRDLTFRDATFTQGSTVDHRYLFDGYRASYLFRAVKSSSWTGDVGASLQVRNAAVSFTDVDRGTYAVETDIGLVYALKGRVRYDSPWGLWAAAELDAISTFGAFGVGGALIDGSLTLGVPLRPDADFFFRLRYVGGGADVPRRDLYNWAHLGSATIGVRFDLASLGSAVGARP